MINFTIFISKIYRFFLFPGAAVLYFEFLPGRLFRSGPFGPGLPAVLPFYLCPVLTPWATAPLRVNPFLPNPFSAALFPLALALMTHFLS